MMRSMFSGVSGLRNHQIRMDVIGNNIANVNTTGFKAGRATFAEMFNQTLRGAGRPSEDGSLGGTNPRQIGLGVTNSSIDTIHTQGQVQVTDRPLDVTIEGEGFFIVRDGDHTFYTRAGNLFLDAFGYLVTVEGMFVQGLMALDADAWENAHPDIVDRVSGDEFINWGQDVADFDPEANRYREGEDEDERFTDVFGRIAIPGTFRDIRIDQLGNITAINEDGDSVIVGMLALATFLNPGGLENVGGNRFRESNNSGPSAFGLPGMGGQSGLLKPGALEMSNVDLSREFTDMIVTQRGFQANSRIITVSDTMLEELVNLKR